MQLIVLNKNGAKHINIILAVALANLALMFLSWKDVIPELVSNLGQSPETASALVEFLKVLPEEMSSSKRLPLTDDDLKSREVELLSNNAEDVLTLLVSYIQQPELSSLKPLIFQCLDSWLTEIDSRKIVNSPIIDIVFQALNDPNTFESASSCVCTLVRETREVDESVDMINALYPRIVALRPLIKESKDDLETFRCLTLIFAEAGESWHMLAARSPKSFRPLVEGIAECAAFDEDLDVVQYTFYFWYDLAEVISLDRYDEARNDFGDIYLQLLKVFVNHLRYPIAPGDNSQLTGKDLFDGNHENDDKFRSFRHEMAGVLKDCCKVVGSSKALSIPYQMIYESLEAQSQGKVVPWQYIEAPLFAVRSMGREISKYENEVMPLLMKVVENLPENDMIRYTATLFLGRYSEWSEKHPEFLELQINYITVGFSSSNTDVVHASAQAFKELCYDCGKLLVNYVDQIYPFYEQLGAALPLNTYYNVTYGIADIVSTQPMAEVEKSLQRFCEPICHRLIELSQLSPDKALFRNIADQIELLVIFVREVKLCVPLKSSDPTVKFIEDVMPVLNGLIDRYGDQSIEISERYCKFVRSSILNVRLHLIDLIPSLAEKIAAMYDKTHFGCYLWVSGAIVREYSIDETPQEIFNAVWVFAEQLISSFARNFSVEIAPNVRNHPDRLEDFFLMMQDVLLGYPFKLITSPQLGAVYEVSKATLDLFEVDPVVSVCRFLIDLFAYGTRYSPNSQVHTIPEEVQNLVRELAVARGGELFQKIVLGLITTLPRDAEYEATALMIKILQLVPAAQASSWLAETLDSLPSNSVSAEEKNKLLQSYTTSLMSGNMKKARSQINDFVGWYRRRVLSRREGKPGSTGSATTASGLSAPGSSASGLGNIPLGPRYGS